MYWAWMYWAGYFVNNAELGNDDMSAVIIGNIVGRALLAYFLVWLVVFLFKKFKYKQAFKATISVKGCTAIGALFALPLMNHMGAAL